MIKTLVLKLEVGDVFESAKSIGNISISKWIKVIYNVLFLFIHSISD